MTERLGLNARIVKPEEKAAEKWKYDNLGEYEDEHIPVVAFLAGVEWERKQILKEKLDKWDGKNLKKGAKR